MMNIVVDFIYTNRAALLSLIGTIFAAISIGTNSDGGNSPQIGGDKGPKDIATFNHPRLFKVGLILIFLGFLFQLRF